MIKKEQAVVIGTGILPVREAWGTSLRELGSRVVRMAIRDAGNPVPDALYIGNAYANVLSHQANLGALISENSGFSGIESYSLEAAGASGAAAFRSACLAVQSGFVDVAVAAGIEKFTETTGSEGETTASLTLNYEYESSQGMTLLSQAALVAQRYLSHWELDRGIFESAVLSAYRNAQDNPNAMFHGLDENRYRNQGMTANPLGVYDSAFLADGAAAAVIVRESTASRLGIVPLAKVIGSAAAVDPLSLHDRHDLLAWDAARKSTLAALRQASLTLDAIDSIEAWDGHVIELILALEAMGLLNPGEGWRTPPKPVNITGGCLGRGNPVGASGMYQIVEMVNCLRNHPSGENALVQAVGGCGSTVITHILSS